MKRPTLAVDCPVAAEAERQRTKEREERIHGLRALWAEFIGTALFVWAGCGSAVASNHWTDGAAIVDSGALVGISLGFGLTISLLVYAIGFISGGHMNPAVTFAFVLLRVRSIKSGLMYILAQCAGAVFGSLLLWGCTASLTARCTESSEESLKAVCLASELPDGEGYGPPFGLGVNQVGKYVSNGSAFLIELIGTYLLVFVVLQTVVHSKSNASNAAPIAIGWAVLVVHLILIPFTGCGINPARSLGPMIVDSMGGFGSVAWVRGWWVFYTAPFIGSALATLTFHKLFQVDFVNDLHDLKVKMNKMVLDTKISVVNSASNLSPMSSRNLFSKKDDDVDGVQMATFSRENPEKSEETK